MCACRFLGILPAVWLLAGVLLPQEEPLSGNPGHAGAVQPAGAPGRRQMGPQLGHQVSGCVPVRHGCPHHRCSTSLPWSQDHSLHVLKERDPLCMIGDLKMVGF